MPAHTQRDAAYRRIEADLRARIERGDWSAGAMLPGRRDLAREYGVSLVTVDRAVAPLLTDGLLRSDSRRGTFVASPITPALAGKPALAARTIAIVAPLYVGHRDHLALNNLLVQSLLTGMEGACAEAGPRTVFINRVGPDGGLLPLADGLASAAATGADAVILIALGLNPGEVDGALAATTVPVVCVTSSALSRPVPHVFYDNHAAGYQAAEHLIEGGSRSLLVLAPFAASWVDERIQGVRAAARHAGLPKSAVRTWHAAGHPWANEEDPELLGMAAARAALDAGPLPGGIVCVNDGVAFGLLRVLEERGMRPGAEVAVVGFDNHPLAIERGLTSLRAPMEAMGQEAVRLIHRQLAGATADYQVRLRWALMPRASSRRACPQTNPEGSR